MTYGPLDTLLSLLSGPAGTAAALVSLVLALVGLIAAFASWQSDEGVSSGFSTYPPAPFLVVAGFFAVLGVLLLLL